MGAQQPRKSDTNALYGLGSFFGGFTQISKKNMNQSGWSHVQIDRKTF